MTHPVYSVAVATISTWFYAKGYSGNVAQKDLYYAIHAFSWTKSGGFVTLRDRYDFAPGDYNGIAGTAVNTMYLAQQAGVLVPFYLSIRK